MNYNEKALADKLIGMSKGSIDKKSNFSFEEQLILDQWIVLGYLNRYAFHDMTPANSMYRKYYYGLGFPFNFRGYEEVKKSRYFRFRDSDGIKITRDIFTLIAFFASLLAIIFTLIN